MTKQSLTRIRKRQIASSQAPRNDQSMDKQFFVYIMTNHNNRVLYTGVTNDLKRRVFEHREGIVEGFTKRYRCKKYYEIGEDAYAAISREKQIKGGSRAKKLQLIEAFNPGWRDLYDEL